MNRKRKLRLCAAAALLLIALFLLRPQDTPEEEPAPPGSGSIQAQPTSATIGEEILADYADPDRPPKHDLELVDRVLLSYRTLVKNHTSKPVGTNADFVDALCGDNPAKQVFLPRSFPHLSQAGELLDRWGTPLFFHAEASDKITLRSAGPDRKMWTPDDVER